MKKYLLFYLVILPCVLFSISSEEQGIPSEMLLSPNNSITHTQVDIEQDYLETNEEETSEELTDANPTECSAANCSSLIIRE